MATVNVPFEPTSGLYLHSNLANIEDETGGEWVLDQLIPHGFRITDPDGNAYLMKLNDFAKTWIDTIRDSKRKIQNRTKGLNDV